MTNNHPARTFDPGRRRLLTTGGLSVAAVVLGGCTTRAASPAPALASTTPTGPGSTTAGQAAILATESRRVKSGKSAQYTLTPQHTQVDLGGVVVKTMAYGSTIPGPLIRANVGDELSVTVKNLLTDTTSVHSHGVAMRNDMDGAAPASKDIAAGGQFTYTYTVPHAGTYWAHPHVGIQTDYGLYAPIVFDDPNEKAAYDSEWIVVLDDWIDGVGKSPQQELADLQAGSGGMAMGGMGVGTSALLGGDAGDIKYPHYLINGRIPAAPVTFNAKAGQRVRIRIINAGADTAFRVALGGHVMTVTHTDGYPVVPKEVDALLIGMAERYDVVVTLKDGVFPLVALAEGKGGLARALIRTGSGQVPTAGVQPAQLQGRIGLATALLPAPVATLPAGTPDVQLTATLGGGMMPTGGRSTDGPTTTPFRCRCGRVDDPA